MFGNLFSNNKSDSIQVAAKVPKKVVTDPEFDQLHANVGHYHTVLIDLKTDVEEFLSSCQDMGSRINRIAESFCKGLMFDESLLHDAEKASNGAAALVDHFQALAESVRKGVQEPLESALQLNETINRNAAEREQMLQKYEEAKKEVERTPARQTMKRNQLISQMNNAWEHYLQFNSAAVKQLYDQLQVRQSVLRSAFVVLKTSQLEYFAVCCQVWQSNQQTGSQDIGMPPRSERLPSTDGKIACVESLPSFRPSHTLPPRSKSGSSSSIRTSEAEIEAMTEEALAIVEKIAFDDCMLVTLSMACAEVQASDDIEEAKVAMMEASTAKSADGSNRNRLLSMFKGNGNDVKTAEKETAHEETAQFLAEDPQDIKPFEFLPRSFSFERLHSGRASRTFDKNGQQQLDVALMFAGVQGVDHTRMKTWSLAAASTFLFLPDLGCCLAVCKRWEQVLRERLSYWQESVRNGGVPALYRGRFWFLLVLGKLPWQKAAPSNSAGLSRSPCFEKGLYKTLVQRAFSVVQIPKDGEDSMGTELEGKTKHNFNVQKAMELETDLNRTFRTELSRFQSPRHETGSGEKTKEEAEWHPSGATDKDKEVWQGWQSYDTVQGEGRGVPLKRKQSIPEVEEEGANQVKRKISKLRRILYAFAIYHQKISYCQGMNYVARMLLDVCNGEEEHVFWIMVTLCNDYSMSGMWSQGLQRLNFCFFAFQRLIQDDLPVLYQHFQDSEISVSMFTSRWFVTLFSSFETLTMPTVMRLWDIFLMEKWDIVFKTALAVLEHFQEHLLSLDFEGILSFMNSPLQRMSTIKGPAALTISCPANETIDITTKLIKKAVKKQLRHNYLSDLEGEYHLNDF